MTYKDVMTKLEELGTEQNRKIYTRHGCDIEQFGVSMANLKKVLKPINKDKELGYQLFHSNNADAIYLSQWIVDYNTLTIDDIKRVLSKTEYYMLLENAIPNSVIKNQDLSFKIIDEFLHSDNFKYRQVAYSLLSLMLLKYDLSLLDMELLKSIMKNVSTNIHNEQNRVRYTMNNFLIACGGIGELNDYAKELAKTIGKVEVFMGETSCKVPDAYSYIGKMEQRDKIRY